MLDSFAQQQMEVRQRQKLDELVSKGMMTSDQVSSAVGTRPGESVGSLIADVPQTDLGLGEAAATLTPDYEQQLESIEQDIEGMYARAYGQRPPNLQESLAAFSQNPAFSPSERRNMAENVPNITAEQNAAFDMLGTDAKQRVIHRIGKNNSPDIALGGGLGKTFVGPVQEMGDMFNRWDSFSKTGFGLPGMKEHWDRDRDKYGVFAPVSMVGGILWGTVKGFVTGVRDIAKGDAMLEDFLHVGSMAAIPFTLGASAGAAAGKAAYAGMTVGNAHRMGRVWAAFNKMPAWVKRQTQPGTGTWGGLNIRNWKEGGNLARGAMGAETLEYATNPEEIWYEIIGDVGIQGATRAFGNTSEWVKDQLTDPEKQMRAQERGIAKRIAKVRKIDTEAADTFQELYDNVQNHEQDGAPVGTDVSESRIALLDTLIQNINVWEANTKIGWMNRQNKDPKDPESIKEEVVAGYRSMLEQVSTQEKEAAQTASEPPEAHTPTPPEQVAEEEIAAATPAPPSFTEPEIPAVETPEAPEPPPEAPSDTPEADSVSTMAQSFEGRTLNDLDLGEIEGINESTFTQDTEDQNRVVRTAIEEKVDRVNSQVDAFLQARYDAAQARAEAEQNPDDDNLQRIANEADQNVENAFENWLNAINSKIGNEPEGEESTNEDYIADETARNQRYEQLGHAFLDIAADPDFIERQLVKAGHDMAEDATQVTAQRIRDTALETKEVLSRQLGIEPTPEPEVEPEPAPEAPPEEPPEVAPEEPAERRSLGELSSAAFEIKGSPLNAGDTEMLAAAETQKGSPLTEDEIRTLLGIAEAPVEPPTPEPETPTEPPPTIDASQSNRQRVRSAIEGSSESLTTQQLRSVASTDDSPLTQRQVQSALQSLRRQGVIESFKDGQQTKYRLVSEEPAPAPEEPPEAPTETPETPQETPTHVSETAEPLQEIVRQAETGERLRDERIGTANTQERYVAERSMGTPVPDPVFESSTAGGLEAYRIGNSNRYAALPTKGLNIVEAFYEEGGWRDVFDMPGYAGETVQFADMNLVRPAVFEKQGENWALVEKGLIDIGKGTETEPAAPEAATPPATDGVNYINSLFDQIEEETEETESQIESPLFGTQSYTDQLVESLEEGRITLDDARAVLTTAAQRVAELTQKTSLTTAEARELSAKRKAAAHLRDVIAIWQHRGRPPGASDIIDGVLYFKSTTSQGAHQMFSNFFPTPLRIGSGAPYATVEHYFQSQKFADTKLETTVTLRNGSKQSIPVSEAIRRAATPGEAFSIANQNFNRLSDAQREAWLARRDQVMQRALETKLADPTAYTFGTEKKTFAQALLDTGNMPLVHVEHVTTERRAITNAPPYWGAYLTPNATRMMTDTDGTQREVPAPFSGENRLGVMLMAYRAQLRDPQNPLNLPTPMDAPKMIAVDTLPVRVQEGLEALNLTQSHIYVTPKTQSIINRIIAGEMVVGIGGGRKHISSVTGYYSPSREWVSFDEETILERKQQLAIDKGWIADADGWNAGIEARVDVYNRTQQEAANAARAVGEASAIGNAIIATGGAFGVDVDAVRGAVGGFDKVNSGTALVMMPEGIQKRPNPTKAGQPLEYNPNVPELDHQNKDIGGISLHPEEHAAGERISTMGTPTFTRGLMNRNGVVTSFSNVFFVTHANEVQSGTMDAAQKALDTGRPIVMLDPAMFNSPLPGSEALMNQPGVYVLYNNPDQYPLYSEKEVLNERTGAIETRRTWYGNNILRRLQQVAELHDPGAAFSVQRQEAFRNHTANWTEADIKDRLRELHRIVAEVRTPIERLQFQYEVMMLNALRAERHPSPSRTSPTNFEYVTQLDPTERQVTGGLIGLRNYENFQEFHDALKRSGTKVFVDVRQNTYVKERGTYEEDWTHGEQLRNAFLATDIIYLHAAEFTPNTATRQYQMIVDELTSIQKMQRGALDAAFTSAYFDYLQKENADLGMFLKNVIAMHIGYQNTQGSAICFGCVEHESGACHRSMLGEIMRDVLGLRVLDVHAGGITTPYQPHAHDDSSALAPPVYPGTTRLVTTPQNAQYVPSLNSRMELIGFRADPHGSVESVEYRHADHPGYVLRLTRNAEGTLSFAVGWPQTAEASLLQREAQIENSFGAPEQVTPFLSEIDAKEYYRNTPLDAEGIPEIAEHLFRAFTPSVRNPGIYESTENVASADDTGEEDSPLIPKYQGGRLKWKVVMTTPPQQGYEYSRERWQTGERKEFTEDFQTRDESQRVTIRDEGVPWGERQQPTEHETYHYWWRETPDIEVRLSPSHKYISAIVPRGKRILVPTSFPLNVQIHQTWEAYRETDRLANVWGREGEVRTESQSLYNFLSINPHLWYAVNADNNQPLQYIPPHGLPQTANALAKHVYAAVYGGMTPEAAEADWQRVRNFIARGKEGHLYGVNDNAAEVEAALRFATRVPAPPNILTQVRQYLSALNKAIKRADPSIETLVPLPVYQSHEPHVLNVGLLNEDTNSDVGDTAEMVDPEIEGSENLLREQVESQAELEDVEPETSTDAELEAAITAADAETQEVIGDDIRQDLAQTSTAAGAAGIPFPSEIGAEVNVADGQIVSIAYTNTGHFQEDWFDTFETIAIPSENGVDTQWANGTLQIQTDIWTVGADGRWHATDAKRKGGLQSLVNNTAASLLEVFSRHHSGQFYTDAEGNQQPVLSPTQIKLQGILDRLDQFSFQNDFSDLDLWQEDGVVLSELLNTLKDAYRALVQYGGLGDFELKAHLLTRLPYGGVMENGQLRRADVVMTNTGLLIPFLKMGQYIVNPELKQVVRRPPTQLNMIIDEMEMIDPETGASSTATRFFADGNQQGQVYELISETDTEIEVAVVGTQDTLRFSKEARGVVIRENRAEGVRSLPIFIDGWQEVPLNTADTTRRAIAPVALAIRDGFYTSGNVPLQLYNIDMRDEGTWSYFLKGEHAFDAGPDGVRRSENYSFTVSVDPTPGGFVYTVGAYEGVGEAAAPVAIFKDADGVSTHTTHVAIRRNGERRSPHDAILQGLWFQRQVAMENNWELPQNPDNRVTTLAEYDTPPSVEDWEVPSDVHGADPNDVYFEPWHRWSREIAAIYGQDVVREIEASIFEAPYPIYTRGDALIELESIIQESMDENFILHGTPLRRLIEFGVPGLLREHLIAQNVFLPSDPNFIETRADSPVVHTWGHRHHPDYGVQMLEGGGLAEITYKGVVIGSVDFTNTDIAWDVIGSSFNETVQEHTTRRKLQENYSTRTLTNGDVVHESETEGIRIRFSASRPHVIGETETGRGWVPKEETRHNLEKPLAAAPLYQQYNYVERIESQLESVSVAEARALATEAETPPPTEAGLEITARYTGTVEELPPDIDDHAVYQPGGNVPQIRRFRMEGYPIEIHLLMPDLMDSPMREEGERRDAWRRVVFFHPETGHYLRWEPLQNGWERDIHTFQGAPVEAFQPLQSMETLPEFEYPSDPDAADIPDTVVEGRSETDYDRMWVWGPYNIGGRTRYGYTRRTQRLPHSVIHTAEGRSAGFAELRAEVDAAEDAHRNSQIWMHIEGSSDELIKQKVEDIYANPNWREGNTREVVIATETQPQGLDGTAAATRTEIEARSETFVERIHAYNQNRIRLGNTVAQPTRGLQPDGILIGVPNTPTAIQSIGFEEGNRYYRSADGWEFVVSQTTPNSFEVAAAHARSGASLTIRNIDEIGFTAATTRADLFTEDVLSVYQAEGYFQEGEEQVLINAFDNAAVLAAEFAHTYAKSTQRQGGQFHLLKGQHPTVEVSVNTFIAPAVPVEGFTDHRMQQYAALLPEDMAPATREEVLTQLQDLETERRNLQNGLETAVANYRRQHAAFERILEDAGIIAHLRPRFDRRTSRAVRPNFEGVRNTIYRNVQDRTVSTGLIKMIQSLEGQFDRLMGGWGVSGSGIYRVGWASEINRVRGEILDLKRRHFRGGVFGRYQQRTEPIGEDVTFAYLSEFLDVDEMSGQLLNPGRQGAASAIFDYKFDVDETHPGYGLILDIDTFNSDSGSLTLESTLERDDLRALLRRDPSITDATTAFTAPEGVDIQDSYVDRVLRAVYHFNNNPFIEIRVVSAQTENFERIIVGVESRLPARRQDRDQIRLTLEVEDTAGTESERIERIPKIVEQFALANYDILSTWLNPVSKPKVEVQSWGYRNAIGTYSTLYRITDTFFAEVLEIKRGEYLVGFKADNKIFGEPLRPGTHNELKTQVGEAVDASTDPDLVENADILSLTMSPGISEWYNFSNYVVASTKHAALERAVLQKLANPENTEIRTALRENLINENNFVSVESRVGNNLVDQVPGISSEDSVRRLLRMALQEQGTPGTHPEQFHADYTSVNAAAQAAARALLQAQREGPPHRRIQTPPLGEHPWGRNLHVPESLFGELNNAYMTYRAHMYSRANAQTLPDATRVIDTAPGTMGARPRTEAEMQSAFSTLVWRHYQRLEQQAQRGETESDVRSPLFIGEDGSLRDPFLSDVLPVGAEDIRHPETRQFIAEQWSAFLNAFTDADAQQRRTLLNNLVKAWQRAYFEKWGMDAVALQGVMLEIRDLAARGAFTAYLDLNDVAYADILRWSSEIDTSPDLSPHIAYAAVRAAGVRRGEVIDVEDAGDGLIAAMLGADQAFAFYSENRPLRRAVFNQQFPDLEIEQAPSGTSDVRLTSNAQRQSPSDLMSGVNPYGRLVVYGNSDWHRASARIIATMENFDSVADYKAHLIEKAVDPATQALHLSLFSEWKNIGRPVHTLAFQGDNSPYYGETGYVIVVDNEAGERIGTEKFVLSNQTDRKFEDYPAAFAAVARTRPAPHREILARQKQAQKRKEAQDRAKATIKIAANRDPSQGAIYKTHPRIEMDVLKIAKQVQRENLIPRGTRYSSIEELAVIADIARNPSMATTQILLVRDNTVHASVLGAVRSGEDVRADIADIERMLPQATAAGYEVIAIANRPSGDTSVSDIDKELATALADKYSGFKYLFIKNTDTYSLATITRDADGTITHKAFRENVALNRSAQQTAPLSTAEPSWVQTEMEIGSPAESLIQAVASDFEDIHTGHINILSQMVESDDNWAVVALMNQDGTLADMVRIPNAFNLNAEGVDRAIGTIKGLYGGADAYLILSSAQEITENPEFFENTAWGQYLSETPDLRAHLLVGAGSHHANRRIQTYAHTPRTQGRLRLTSQQVAINAKADMAKHLAGLITGDVVGNVWEQARAFYIETLDREFERTAPLTALEEIEFRNQLNLATARALQQLRMTPEIADIATVKATFTKLKEQSEKWQQKTTMPLNEKGLSVSPEKAYLMHYLGAAAENEVVVVPDAREGMLLSAAPYHSFIMATEPDANRRNQLRNTLGIETINDGASTDLAAYWQQNFPETPADVILLDSRNIHTFWQQVNQALHTLDDGGRLVAHIHGNIEDHPAYEQSIAALAEYYQLRRPLRYDGSTFLIVDRVTEGVEYRWDPTVVNDHNATWTLLAEAESLHGWRRGFPEKPVAREPEEAPEEAPVAEEKVSPDGTETSEQIQHTKPSVVDPERTESHREWLTKTNAALAGTYSVGSLEESQRLYDDMMTAARYVPTHIGTGLNAEPRPEADVRAEIYMLWENLLGFTPPTGWDKFIARLTAATLSGSYDPNMVYQLKLYELLDPGTAVDLRNVIDPRTNRVNTRISTAYRQSHRKPIKMLGESVADAEDAAILFQPFRNPNHEMYLFVGVDAEGRIVKSLPMTSRSGYGSDSFDNVEIQRILADNPDVEGFWLVHNHPETISAFSDTDMRDSLAKAERFEGLYRGTVTTDTGEFSAYTADGQFMDRQQIRKPMDTDFLNRPQTHGILGASAGTHPSAEVEQHTLYGNDPSYIATLTRDMISDMGAHPDMVTFIFVRPEIDTPQGAPRMQITGMESHTNLHALDAEALSDLIREMNTANGAHQTFVVVNNPTEKAYYDVNSAWDTVMNGETPVVSGIYVDTEDVSFPSRRMQYDLETPLSEVERYTSGGTARMYVDPLTGDVREPEKQRKFTEFLVFQYLSQGEAINWTQARAYSDTYFDQPLTDSQLQFLGDAAFKEYLRAIELEKRLIENHGEIETVYMVADNMYRRLVNPSAAPAGIPGTAQERVNDALIDNLTYLMLNLAPGETFNFARGLYDSRYGEGETSPLGQAETDGVHIMQENLLHEKYNENIEEADGVRRTPTVTLHGMGHRTARGDYTVSTVRNGKQFDEYVQGRGEDPFATIRHQLAPANLAPGGRLVVRIEGGLFNPLDTMQEKFSAFTGSEGIPFNTPLLAKVIETYFKEKQGGITVDTRNAAWRDAGLTAEQAEYYEGQLDYIFDPEKFTPRAFIRFSEFNSHLVIDKTPATGETGVDLAIDASPDTRTLVEKYTNLRYTRPKISATYLRKPPSAAATAAQRPPQISRNAPHIASPLARRGKTYQGELSARLGANVGVQPTSTGSNTEFGRKKHFETESHVESPMKASQYPQIIIKGLENRVDRNALEALFKQHGDVFNVIVPSNYQGNIGMVTMTDPVKAASAIRALNGTLINGALLDVSEVKRDSKTPLETIPTGDPNSLFAWDVLLNSPLMPKPIKRKYMDAFDIESISDRDGNRTYLRKEDAGLGRKIKSRWQSSWAGRVGQDLSRPINHIQRWGKPGLDVAAKMTDTYYEAQARGGDAFSVVKQVYADLRENPKLQEELQKGSVEKVYNSQSGFVPAWVRKVPAIEIWKDEQHNVERVVHKGQQLTHLQPDGRWATDLYLSNAPLLDAWVNTIFGAHNAYIFPKDLDVAEILRTQLQKVRDAFDRQDHEWIDANREILAGEASGLLTPIDSPEIDDITEALHNDTLNKEALRAYAERFGIEMPAEFEIYRLRRRGTMRQWKVMAVDEPRELFRIRQFASQESVVAKVRNKPDLINELTPRERERHEASLGLYADITNRTLVYAANPRNPIWSKKSGEPYQLYAGRPHDMPRMINWASMNPYGPENSRERESYDDYLKSFFNMNMDAHKNDPGWTYRGQEWTLGLADDILKQNFNGFNDMRYDPIEDDSELLYPSVAYESQSTLGEFALMSAQRTAEVLNYGQDGDIIKGVIDELQNPEYMDLSPLSKAVLKLRRAVGYTDFAETYDEFTVDGNVVVPFYTTRGVERTTRPDFNNMTAADWNQLVEAGIVTRVDTDPGRVGFYAWADPAGAPGETTRRQRWDAGGEVEFEIAENAGALINYAYLNLDSEILSAVEQAKYRYAIGKDTLERMHTWNPKLLEMNSIEEKLDAIYADSTSARDFEASKLLVNVQFEELVKRERERRNRPIYQFLYRLQKIATGLLMRLSWASQFGTFHNPVHRTGFTNFAQGVRDEWMNPNERERLQRLGVYFLDITDMVAMSGENVSQENIGFNQKLLGGSKYFHWNVNAHGGFTQFMKAFYNRGNWTPFAFLERRLRGTAAIGGKHLTKDVLTRLLIPGKIEAEGEALAAKRAQDVHALEELDVTIPHLLNAVLELKDPETEKPVMWTEALIDELTEMSEKQAGDTFAAKPHLAAVSRLTDRVMQVLPDYAHFAQSGMHRMRLFSDHPFVRAMFVFQTMMVEQTRNIFRMTKYTVDSINKPAEMARKRAGTDGISITEAAKLTAPEVWRRLPHLLLSAGSLVGAGFIASMLTALVRGRVPDDEDMAVMTWLTNAAVFGAASGYVESAWHYRGLERQFAGALVGLTADFIRDPVGAAWRYGGRPFPVDFRPVFGHWVGDIADVDRSIAAGGFRPSTGTSLEAVRPPR